jgi:hypothetical protein
VPMMSTWLLGVLGCSSYVCFLCFLLVDNQVIHLVRNNMKASKENQGFMSIIHMTQANYDHYHLFTDILLVKAEATCSSCVDLR